MESIIYEDKIENSIQKIGLLKKQEDINFEALAMSLKEMNTMYKTSQTSTLSSIQEEVKRSLEKIKSLHNNNIFVLQKNLDKYRELKKATEKRFDELI